MRRRFEVEFDKEIDALAEARVEGRWWPRIRGGVRGRVSVGSGIKTRRWL